MPAITAAKAAGVGQRAAARTEDASRSTPCWSGVVFGWAPVRAMHSQRTTVFSLPVRGLVIMVVLAGAAGVVAAILPSRRAAKLNILRALVSE